MSGGVSLIYDSSMTQVPQALLEELKQVDARAVSLYAQSNRLFTAFFAAIVGFWAWVGTRETPLPLIPITVLAIGLMSGVMLLDVNARSITTLRSYKIVFLERASEFSDNKGEPLFVLSRR